MLACPSRLVTAVLDIGARAVLMPPSLSTQLHLKQSVQRMRLATQAFVLLGTTALKAREKQLNVRLARMQRLKGLLRV
jgi:2-keto-3-deoxy-L-rhamnonate aldolase RhmA